MKGYTLVEVILVVALISLLVASVIPRFSSSSTGLDAATHKVRSDLKYAQSLAMNRGVLHGVDFVSGGAYVIYRLTPGSAVTDPLTLQNFSENLSRFGSSHIDTTTRVEFDTLGRPVTGGGTTITIVNGSQSRSLQVNPNTGHLVIP